MFLFICIIVLIVLLLLANKKQKNRMTTLRQTVNTGFRCPNCGAQAKVIGDRWECGFCGDCGRLSR